MKVTKYDLLNNAKSSLTHAVQHLTNEDGVSAEDLKYAIRDVAHVVELLIKEKIRKVHPAFILEDVDRYPSPTAFTLKPETAMKRLRNLCGITLSKKEEDTITACREIRNRIEHYEFEIKQKEAEGMIGRMLSFIFDFSKRYLQIDLEHEFRQDHRWGSLIDIHEFWSAHSDKLQDELIKNEIPIDQCPACGGITFKIEDGKCALCGHMEATVTCDICHKERFEWEIEVHDEVDYGPEGAERCASISVCEDCLRKDWEAENWRD